MNEGEQARQWPWGSNYLNLQCYKPKGVDCGYNVLYSACGFSPYNANRVGEAKNPGPFRISALNVQSLHCALDESKLDWEGNDILALSETCATQYVLDKAAKIAASQGRHSCSSNPVKRRHFKRGTVSDVRGESAGVWFASKHHTRPIELPWPDDIATLCRACDAIVYTPGGMFYMACIYGFHQGFVDASPKTDRILEAVYDRSRLLKLPAVVVGDFNAPLDGLPVWTSMCERGWCDAALAHQRATGQQPVPTYKEVSRIDFVIMNDMAHRAFLKYEASELPISDHRMISAVFQWDKCQGLSKIFRMPRDLAQLGIPPQAFAEARVPVVCQMAFEQAVEHGTIEDAWSQFLQSMEQVASNVVSLQNDGPIPPRYLGKDKCKFVKIQNLGPVIKKGRSDSFQAEVQDCGVQLRQRITQVRRFDAYMAQLRATGPMPPQRVQSLRATWLAILKATGFHPGFPQWFVREFGIPCPFEPPQLRVAAWMRELLADSVPKWRSHYNNTRVRQTRDAFAKDWTAGGKLFHRALRAPNPPPVDAIDRVGEVAVQLLRSRKKNIACFRVVNEDLHTVSIGQKWTQGPAVGLVAAIEKGVIQIRIVEGSFKSGVVSTATTCQDPCHALVIASNFWKSYWCKPKQTDCDNAAAHAVVRALPQKPSMSCCITMLELRNALKTLPVGKARGMDATTNWELKYLCEGLQEMLLKLLNKINSVGSWPKALTRARMHLIRKTHELGDMTSTRPICILPNVYRLWGKIMTAKCFRHLKDDIPPTIFGSVPGRSSTDLAMQLQAEIEEHLTTGQPLFGASLDLHKAFNTLSRPLLARMCSKLGLGHLWEPYSVFLNELQRFFTIRQQWSEPILSNTGVPEGCPLSVVMMMIMTWSVTAHLEQVFPGRPMSSYVDDWSVRDETPECLVRRLVYLQKLTDDIGLCMSLKKTVPYATTPYARKTLAQCLRAEALPCVVTNTGVGLGVQFQARCAKVTDLREKRVNDALPKLKKLKIMPWNHTKKASLLLSGIYPAMFYGCEFHDMGLHFISHIRSMTNGAVWKDKPYLSHFLTPILSTKPIYEPWLWILRRVYQSFRRLHCMLPDQTKMWWNLAIGRKTNKHTIGPITILQAHLRRLGWTLKEDFECQSQDGLSFNLARISQWQYKNLVTTAWQDWLVPKLKIKHNLPDLTSFDITASSWQLPNAQNEGFMATVRSGGLFTNKAKSRICSQVSPNCVMCGELDGMTHRAYACSASEQIRQENGWQSLKDVPRSCLVYGLFPRPLAQDEYFNALDELKVENLVCLPDKEEPIHIFTDGSCSQPAPSKKSERRAAFAVRLAHKNSHESQLLATGTLPGRKQTAFRAELWAVMIAMSTCTNSVIYTDCKGVFLGILKLQKYGWSELAWLSSPDIDLWKGAWSILSFPGRRLVIEWTRSHQSLSDARSANEMWRTYHNGLTDRSASVEVNPLPDNILPIWQRLVIQNAEQAKLRSSVMCYLKEIWRQHSAAEANAEVGKNGQ